MPAISTGDLFRAHVAQGTDLARAAAAYASTGDLVPDDVTTAMVVERLARADCRGGYVVDGFPRTIGQARQLTDDLAAQDLHLDAVLELRVDADGDEAAGAAQVRAALGEPPTARVTGLEA